jgi:hypothetical protein
MYEYKKCDNCNRMLKNSDKVTVIIPDVEVEGRYRKDQEGFRLKLSKDGIEIRTAKIYCKKCLDIKKYFLNKQEEE